MIRARVVAVTQPTEVSGIPADPEALVAYCARVSNPDNQANHGTADRLLRYLQREGHWSPFEMASAVVEVECPRDIARQLLRHRSLKFQEFSQRYAAAPGFVQRSARRQDTANRQASHDDLPAWKLAGWVAAQRALIAMTTATYRTALRVGVAKETARTILPEGCTMSRLYVHGDLRSWIHYLAVREGNGTQAEHVELARAIRAALAPHFPLTMEGPK